MPSERSGVDLVVNVFERTYRKVLEPGAFAARVAQHRHRFARRTLVVNNVDDRAAVERLAGERIAAGELDAVFFVADRLDGALRTAGLTRRDLGRVPYFSDWALVAVTLPGPPWLVHFDADAVLRTPVDWVARSIELMERDRRIMTANPLWEPPAMLEETTMHRTGDFAIGRGFSDQAFLVRRAELAAPVYGQRCLARLRYPMAHVAHIFEARVDAHMRHHGRLRATFLPARWDHGETMGVSYPRRSLLETARFARNQLAVRALLASPVRPGCTRYM